MKRVKGALTRIVLTSFALLCVMPCCSSFQFECLTAVSFFWRELLEGRQNGGQKCIRGSPEIQIQNSVATPLHFHFLSSCDVLSCTYLTTTMSIIRRHNVHATDSIGSRRGGLLLWVLALTNAATLLYLVVFSSQRIIDELPTSDPLVLLSETAWTKPQSPLEHHQKQKQQ